jgi:cation diffusion facilitator CzcD-associated flavoprotein CzcO
VVDHIDRFSANGIVLQSGKTLADIIITATGDLVPLETLLFNWIRNLTYTFVYKGLMLSNQTFIFLGVYQCLLDIEK